MKTDPKSLRSPLGRALGLGSAHDGTGHWWLQRVTSLFLIPLSIYFIYSFYVFVIEGGYQGSLIWLRSPTTSTLLILFLVIGFHHTASGLQVVIEDYFHCEWIKITLILVIKFVCALLAILSILAIVKVLFGV